MAAQLFKRLEVEGTTSGGVAVSPTEPNPGFIASKVNAGGGIAPPDPKHAKRNARAKVKQQKAVRQKYVFNTASKRGQRYCDYFNPNSAVQLRVMGMEDTVVRITFPHLTAHIFFCFVFLAIGRCNSPLRAPAPGGV